MSLLKLSPGAERLRRITKAYAAGELPEAEYRRIRADVIAGFTRGETAPSVAFGDETQRRWRVAPDARSPWPAAAAPAAAAPGPVSHRVARRRGILLFGVLAVVLLALAVAGRPLLAAPLDIPPLAERDPNPFTSPRVHVDELRVRDLPVFPHLGLDAAAVTAFLDARLAELHLEGVPGEHGFTDVELDELARLLDAMGVHAPGTTLSAADAGELLALIRAQKARRGLSIVQLEQLAAELGRFYRAHGLPLAVGFVPVQTVDDGIVELAVLPGELAETRIRGEAFPRRLMERAFAGQLGTAVEAARIESVLWRINELPGVRAQGRFSAGADVGTTVLDLEVGYRQRWQARFIADNHGSDATGEGRTLAEARWHNVSGRADWISAGVLATWRPGNSLFGHVEYRAPWPDIATEVGVRAAVDAFDWTGDGAAFSGSSHSLSFGLTRQLQRGREQSTALEFGLGAQWLELETEPDGVVLQDQNVQRLSVGVTEERIIDRARPAGRVPADLAVQVRLGLDGLRIGNGPGIDPGGVVRLDFDAMAWRLIDLPGFRNHETLRLSFDGQAASGALPGTLQMSLGGPSGSRGFAYPTLLADNAVRGRLDLRFRPWSERNLGELLLFADAAAGSQKRQFDGTVSAFLVSSGLGWEFRFEDRLTSQLILAWPLADRSSRIDIDDDGMRLLLQLEYRP